MKIRKITALCTSLLMCASVLAGCGSENEKSTEKKPKKTAGSSVSEKDDELYGYYNLLNEEFENGNVSKNDFSHTDFSFNYFIGEAFKYENNVICCVENDVTIFDINTKDKRTFKLYDEGIVDSYDFINGYFYAKVHRINDSEIEFLKQKTYSIIKVDTNGQIISQINIFDIFPDLEYIYNYINDINFLALPDGKLIIEAKYPDANYLLSSDFKKITKIPNAKTVYNDYETEHSTFDWIGRNGTKVYASYNGGILCLDTETLKWTHEETTQCGDSYGGKYSVVLDRVNTLNWGEAFITDLETNEIIAVCKDYQNPATDKRDRVFYSFAGLSHHILHDETWYNVQIPGDGTAININNYTPLGKQSFGEKKFICPIDDIYYAFEDERGVFLRTYE